MLRARTCVSASSLVRTLKRGSCTLSCPMRCSGSHALLASSTSARMAAAAARASSP